MTLVALDPEETQNGVNLACGALGEPFVSRRRRAGNSWYIDPYIFKCEYNVETGCQGKGRRRG